MDGCSSIIFYNYIDDFKKLEKIEIEVNDLDCVEWKNTLFLLCGAYDELWDENNTSNGVAWNDIREDVFAYENELVTLSYQSQNLYELCFKLKEFSKKLRSKMPEIIENTIRRIESGKFGL